LAKFLQIFSGPAARGADTPRYPPFEPYLGRANALIAKPDNF
jgi:hypothetical protein